MKSVTLLLCVLALVALVALASAGRPVVSPAWVKYCLLMEKNSNGQYFNRLSVTQGFPSATKKIKYGSDGSNCVSTTSGQCAFTNLTSNTAPCLLGSFAPFPGSVLLCETYSTTYGYSYARCTDNNAMMWSQAPASFQYFQPIGFFVQGSNCRASPNNTFMNVGGIQISGGEIRPMINVWTGGKNPSSLMPSTSFNAMICGLADFPKINNDGGSLSSSITTALNGTVHIFDNTRGTTALNIDLSQTIEANTIKSTQVDTSSSSSMTKSWGWSVEATASASGSFMGTGVEYSMTAGYTENSEVAETIAKTNSESAASSVTVSNTITGSIEVPPGTRVKVTEIISNTIATATMAYTLTDATNMQSSETVDLVSSTTFTSGYYVEQFP